MGVDITSVHANSSLRRVISARDKGTSVENAAKNLNKMRSRRSPQPYVRATAKGKPQPTHQIDEDTVSVVFARSGKGGVKIILEVAGSQIPMEVDTGAAVTVILISVYEQYLSYVQLHASTVTLKTYSGETLIVIGEATV